MVDIGLAPSNTEEPQSLDADGISVWGPGTISLN